MNSYFERWAQFLAFCGITAANLYITSLVTCCYAHQIGVFCLLSLLALLTEHQGVRHFIDRAIRGVMAVCRHQVSRTNIAHFPIAPSSRSMPSADNHCVSPLPTSGGDNKRLRSTAATEVCRPSGADRHTERRGP